MRKKNIVCTTLCFLLMLFSPLCRADDLTSAPEGFQWVRVDEIKARFLKPDGWSFSKRRSGDRGLISISKENIDDAGFFMTGLTIIPLVVGHPGQADIAPGYARVYIDVAAENSSEVLVKPWSYSDEYFTGFGITTKNIDPNLGDYITDHLAIGNNRTGAVYLIVFESPVDMWDEIADIRVTLLSNIYFDRDM